MSKNLIIVESPAKSKTIKKYLGNQFEVLASYGHVRDLETKRDAIDVNNNFHMKYKISAQSKKHIDAIKKSCKLADAVYLATDPDREGEAISWHIYEILKNAKLLKDKVIHRVVFNEITKNAVTHAVQNPRDILMPLVNAQQARLGLDFLIGFNLSPLLWKKVRSGLSAGRVQSPALRMIVERQQEIDIFKTKEYWSISAKVKNQKSFNAKLISYNDASLSQFSIVNETQASITVESIIKDVINNQLVVDEVTKKQSRKQPYGPFTTSTLQQEASKKLGFTTKKIMIIAQQLYEGVELGDKESSGLITYMRTDSTSLSNDAIVDIRNYISTTFGDKALPNQPRIFKSKSKNTQEAHEAIRVTTANRAPKNIASYLSKDQFKLYELIWQRTIACQMSHAIMNQVGINLTTDNKKHIFRATGSNVHTPGFLAIYKAETDEDVSESDEGVILPSLVKDDKVDIIDILSKQHFTEPPPKYTEASLVKSLEKHGIGRPSTYASIISTLQQRDYVALESKRFTPTDIGKVVNKFLTAYFKKYVEYNYTMKLESELDSIAADQRQWIPVLSEFWDGFHQKVQEIDKRVDRNDVTQEKLDEKCPECGHKLLLRLGKSGNFIGCASYPDCKYTRQVTSDGSPQETEPVEIVSDRKCPKCDHDLHIKSGRYGKFIGCSNYPKCKHMESLVPQKDTGVLCPKCKHDNIIEKTTRKGKIFYACSGYPKCKNAYWYPPVNESCPKCSSPILLHKSTKKDGEQIICANTECDYVRNYVSEDND